MTRFNLYYLVSIFQYFNISTLFNDNIYIFVINLISFFLYVNFCLIFFFTLIKFEINSHLFLCCLTTKYFNDIILTLFHLLEHNRTLQPWKKVKWKEVGVLGGLLIRFEPKDDPLANSAD